MICRGIRVLVSSFSTAQKRGLRPRPRIVSGSGYPASHSSVKGMAVWVGVWRGFELGIAPVLGLSRAKRVRLVDRLALAADHLLYGLVPSGTRRRARG